MITIIRHTTASGSIYEVRREFDKGSADRVFVRRVLLGDGHRKLGPTQVAKRRADELDDWTEVRDVESYHHRLWIKFQDETRNLVTTPIVRSEELPA